VHFRTSVQRSGPETHWIFLDVASTAHLFTVVDASVPPSLVASTRHSNNSQSGEERLTLAAINLARDLGFSVQCAVADTPSGAQAFTMSHHETRNPDEQLNLHAGFIIIPPGEERERLKSLSLPHLLHLEGLEPWQKPATIESIVTFFMMLGFKSSGDLSRFSLASLQERWGSAGELLWQRLNSRDQQVVSPLLPTEPLEDYVHLDFPVSLVSLLLHQIEKSVEFLFARLQGRRFFASQLVLTLHCEYSQTRHKIVIEPNIPARDFGLFMTLLEDRLAKLNLDNPIRDLEMQIVPCPEKSRQLDFFEPRVSDSDKVLTLFSLLSQSSLQAGLYRIEPAILPEQGWELASSPEERERAAIVPLTPQHFSVDERHGDDKGDGSAITPQPFYGEAVMRAPRPTRVLREPLPLSLVDLEKMRVLSAHPIERFENGWWQGRTITRDYFFAVSEGGECLWVFRDSRTQEYFLHGFFD
jgi:protein ImuB